jgi:putative tricarboxylic transport membrane protein
MLSRDFIGGIAAILLGGLYLFFAFEQRVSALADSVGPAGMPKVLGFLMVALGLILCIQAAFNSIKTRATGLSEWQGQGTQILRAFGLVGLGLVYLSLITILGYAFSIALLLAVVAIYLGAPINWRIAGIAIGGAGVLWAIFVLLLDVPMPSGFF